MSEKDERAGSWFFLNEEELRALSGRAQERSFAKNAIVLSEGDHSDSLYVILDGRVKVFVADADGNEIVLSTMGTGEYFGEMALDGRPRSACVMTTERSRFLVVPSAVFKDFLLNNPAVSVRVIENLIQRVRNLTKNVKSLALMDVYGRVARLLLELAQERDGKLIIDQPLTQQDIASRIGASRGMVSRILKDLTAGGYVSIQSGRIRLNRRPPEHW